jgi:hypothetical protein
MSKASDNLPSGETKYSDSGSFSLRGFPYLGAIKLRYMVATMCLIKSS